MWEGKMEYSKKFTTKQVDGFDDSVSYDWCESKILFKMKTEKMQFILPTYSKHW